jgi:predicted amidohydrolase YtcJ
MSETSRRNFLATLGAFTLIPLERVAPDLVLHNGNFWTVDSRNLRAQAVAISDGRFLAVGSNDEVLPTASSHSRKIDWGGKTVLPGFIDAHAHPASSGRSHLRNVDCDLRSFKAIQQALIERAAKTAPGQWVLGFKYDDTKNLRRANACCQRFG